MRSIVLDSAKRKEPGELFYLPNYKASSAVFPALCLSAIDVYTDLSTTNWHSDFIDFLRDEKLYYQAGKAGEVSSFDCTVSGSDVTIADTTAGNALVEALVEDYEVQGSYTNHRTINVDGTDYAITGIVVATRVITVTGTPTTGAQTAIFYTNRIAGSTTTARVFEASARTLVSAGDAENIAGLRRRDRGQRITGAEYGTFGVSLSNVNQVTSEGAITLSDFNATSLAAEATGSNDRATRRGFDSANSPGARTGATTDPRSAVGHLYIWGVSYTPST